VFCRLISTGGWYDGACTVKEALQTKRATRGRPL